MPTPTPSFHNKRVRIVKSHHLMADGVVGIAKHNGWFGGSGPLSPNQPPETLLTEAHYCVEPEDKREDSKVANLVFSESQLEDA